MSPDELVNKIHEIFLQFVIAHQNDKNINKENFFRESDQLFKKYGVDILGKHSIYIQNPEDTLAKFPKELNKILINNLLHQPQPPRGRSRSF